MQIDYTPFSRLDSFNSEMHDLAELFLSQIKDDLSKYDELLISVAFAFIFNQILWRTGYREVDQDYLFEETLGRKYTDKEWDTVFEIIEQIAFSLKKRIGIDEVFEKVIELYKKEIEDDVFMLTLESWQEQSLYDFIAGGFQY